jgi:hypothetical protein
MAFAPAQMAFARAQTALEHLKKAADTLQFFPAGALAEIHVNIPRPAVSNALNFRYAGYNLANIAVVQFRGFPVVIAQILVRVVLQKIFNNSVGVKYLALRYVPDN